MSKNKAYPWNEHLLCNQKENLRVKSAISVKSANVTLQQYPILPSVNVDQRKTDTQKERLNFSLLCNI